jgi:hypothetical protein
MRFLKVIFQIAKAWTTGQIKSYILSAARHEFDV